MEEEKKIIEEAYVSYEVASLLKDRGFNEMCHRWYDKDGDLVMAHAKNELLNSRNCACPTQQMAARWMREVHDINVQVNLDSYTEGYGSCGFYVVINCKNREFEDVSPFMPWRTPGEDVFFKTYEEAMENGLKAALLQQISRNDG